MWVGMAVPGPDPLRSGLDPLWPCTHRWPEGTQTCSSTQSLLCIVDGLISQLSCPEGKTQACVCAAVCVLMCVCCCVCADVCVLMTCVC